MKVRSTSLAISLVRRLRKYYTLSPSKRMLAYEIKMQFAVISFASLAPNSLFHFSFI